MKYVNLGRSGLKVSRLCLGCMSYGDPERLPQPWSLDEKASRPLIRQALEAGINFFVAMLKSRNSRHSICRTPSTGSFPRFLIRPLHSRRLQQYRTVNPLPWPGVAGSPWPLM
ncbi:hypothetical protein CIW56_00530 [Enterobacter roggenkampii]|nr:hypothetical protein CIW56_00530 [Enterobacter roggenkampii]